ncbi:MAG: class I SAM-dependent methyltransferase [Chthonomonadetes bacterium]|nr:class I SAM-dependent methyltransferase [Chthonomonadetes bacterium]
MAPLPLTAAEHFGRWVQENDPSVQEKVVLVAGCGDGKEARYIHQRTQATVIGFDLREKPPAGWEWEDGLYYLRADVTRLPFRGESFDYVFYHHVIEHVSNPMASLHEIYRVLKPGGYLYIGTPNRHRAVGYVGAAGVTWKQKLLWNWADLKARLQGRFRNELGAHAGFTRRELETMLGERFGQITWLTADYLRFKYGARLPRWFMGLLCRDGVLEFAAPALYALCKK